MTYINGQAGDLIIKGVILLLIVCFVGFIGLAAIDKPVPGELAGIPLLLVGFLVGTRVQPRDVSIDTKTKAVQEHVAENGGKADA